MEEKKRKMGEDQERPGEAEHAGSRLELDSLIIEYQNLFDRSNKLDNKVYITITFCGFLFVFITGLFSGISQLGNWNSGMKAAVTMVYILICIAVVVSYVYLLIYFMRLLQPEQIIRMDPDILQKAGLEDMEEEAACRQLIWLYRSTINEDLVKLKNRCNEFTKGLRFVVPTVILAFIAYGLQLLVQIM
ncbi:MAG: hypothetical protein Q4C66_00725 [Lachnospiraceae bacterium]|nr:hypothetical protein [Lachnospiraceae bacterium]